MFYLGGLIVEGLVVDVMVQIGMFNIVKELNEIKVWILGYMVLFEYGVNVEIKEFLFVFYYGVCLYVLLLLFNQMVFVMMDELIKLWDFVQVVWIEGMMYI